MSGSTINVASGVGLLAEVVLAFRYGHAPPEACQAIRDSELALNVPVPVGGLPDIDMAIQMAGLWCFGDEWPLALEIWGLDTATLVLLSLGMEQAMGIGRSEPLAAFASGMSVRH